MTNTAQDIACGKQCASRSPVVANNRRPSERRARKQWRPMCVNATMFCGFCAPCATMKAVRHAALRRIWRALRQEALSVSVWMLASACDDLLPTSVRTSKVEELGVATPKQPVRMHHTLRESSATHFCLQARCCFHWQVEPSPPSTAARMQATLLQLSTRAFQVLAERARVHSHRRAGSYFAECVWDSTQNLSASKACADHRETFATQIVEVWPVKTLCAPTALPAHLLCNSSSSSFS